MWMNKGGDTHFFLGFMICTGFGVYLAFTLIVSLFDPPPWNRAEVALEVLAWFYVAWLHLELYRVSTRNYKEKEL